MLCTKPDKSDLTLRLNWLWIGVAKPFKLLTLNTFIANKEKYTINMGPLLLRHWYEIMALYYVKSILTEISASRQDRRVLQKSKIIRIKFLSIWGMLQTSRYI